MKQNIFFVSGIDTNIGKSYVTGYLARLWTKQGHLAITQKFIQTGNIGRSEDIELHRQIMQTGFFPEDTEKLTMPQIFSYPASPHLAAELDGREIDFLKIEQTAQILSQRYDRVLLEGAGGLMVPLTRRILTIDYVKRKHYPLILVTSGRLGSINHTLLSLEAIRQRGIELYTLAYNLFPEEEDAVIRQDTEQYLRNYLSEYFPKASFVTVPFIKVREKNSIYPDI